MDRALRTQTIVTRIYGRTVTMTTDQTTATVWVNDGYVYSCRAGRGWQVFTEAQQDVKRIHEQMMAARQY